MTKEKKISLGFVLLESAQCDFAAFAANMRDDWGIDIFGQMDDGENTPESKVFTVDGMMLACGFISGVVPKAEIESCCDYNIFWQEAKAVTSRQKTHIVLAVMDDSLAAKRLFTKAASCWLKTNGALAIYLGAQTLIIPPEIYCESAWQLKESETVPLNLWVYIGLYQDELGANGYTYGLKEFGKTEIEVVGSRHDLLEVYEFIYDIANYVVEYDVLLEDGQTIGFNETEKFPITLSAGVALEGESLKIGW